MVNSGIFMVALLSDTGDTTAISTTDRTYANMSKRPLIDADAVATSLASRKNSERLRVKLLKYSIDSPI